MSLDQNSDATVSQTDHGKQDIDVSRRLLGKLFGAIAAPIVVTLILGGGAFYVSVNSSLAVLAEKQRKLESDVEDVEASAVETANSYTDERVAKLTELFARQTAIMEKLDEDRVEARDQRKEITKSINELRLKLATDNE